jgi:hypothetical protein
MVIGGLDSQERRMLVPGSVLRPPRQYVWVEPSDLVTNFMSNDRNSTKTAMVAVSAMQLAPQFYRWHPQWVEERRLDS